MLFLIFLPYNNYEEKKIEYVFYDKKESSKWITRYLPDIFIF